MSELLEILKAWPSGMQFFGLLFVGVLGLLFWVFLLRAMFDVNVFDIFRRKP